MALSLFTADPTFSQLEKAMDRAFDRAFGNLVPAFPQPAGTLAHTCFACDIVEQGDKYLIVADVPGLSNKELKVELLPDRVLQVSGQRTTQQEAGSKDSKYWRQERTSTRFSRSFTLPEDAVVEGITAHLEHGVLNLQVPKASPPPKPEPRRIPIQMANTPAAITAAIAPAPAAESPKSPKTSSAA